MGTEMLELDVRLTADKQVLAGTDLKEHCCHFEHDFGNLKNMYLSLEAEQLNGFIF